MGAIRKYPRGRQISGRKQSLRKLLPRCSTIRRYDVSIAEITVDITPQPFGIAFETARLVQPECAAAELVSGDKFDLRVICVDSRVAFYLQADPADAWVRRGFQIAGAGGLGPGR